MRMGLLGCGLVLMGAQVHAMGMRSDSRVVARSDDGKVELVLKTEVGPEGGSRRTFVVGAERFLFSDTLSRGSGSRTEYVSQADCEKALRGLQARLKARWSKARLTVHPEACSLERRTGAVEQP